MSASGAEVAQPQSLLTLPAAVLGAAHGMNFTINDFTEQPCLQMDDAPVGHATAHPVRISFSHYACKLELEKV
jgi:hypothetical protein